MKQITGGTFWSEMSFDMQYLAILLMFSFVQPKTLETVGDARRMRADWGTAHHPPNLNRPQLQAQPQPTLTNLNHPKNHNHPTILNHPQISSTTQITSSILSHPLNPTNTETTRSKDFSFFEGIGFCMKKFQNFYRSSEKRSTNELIWSKEILASTYLVL